MPPSPLASRRFWSGFLHPGGPARIDPARQQRWLAAVAAAALLYPIVLSVLWLPTPPTDLREHINWGRHFPLVTWKHPPLQSWAAGLVALTGARDTPLYMAFAQLLNAAGVVYLARAAQMALGRESVPPLLVLLFGALYFWMVVLNSALNADQIQFPLWCGLIYHALAALRDNRWRDWLLAGLFAGLAMLAKYFSAILIAALLIAAVATPPYRRAFRNPGFYAAALIGAALFALNAWPTLAHYGTLTFGQPLAQPGQGLGARVLNLGSAWGAILAFLLPSLALLGILAATGRAARTPVADPPRRFIVTAAVALMGLITAIVLLAGAHYTGRYSQPAVGLVLLAILCGVRVAPDGVGPLTRGVLALWLLAYAVGLASPLFGVHRQFMEPAPAAAAALRARWDAAFACGPAYVVGDKRDAHALGLYYGQGVTGLSLDDLRYAPWADPERLRRAGAILVGRPERMRFLGLGQVFPAPMPPFTFDAPYRRLPFSTRRYGYAAAFVPPQDCPAASSP